MDEKQADRDNSRKFLSNLRKALANNYGVRVGKNASFEHMLRSYCSIYGKPYPKTYGGCMALALKLMRTVKTKISEEERARDRFYEKKRKKLARVSVYNKRNKPKVSSGSKMSL